MKAKVGLIAVLIVVVAATLALVPTQASAHSVPVSALKTVAQANAKAPWVVDVPGYRLIPVLYEDAAGKAKFKQAHCRGVGKPVKRGKASVFSHFDCVVPMTDLNQFTPGKAPGKGFATVEFSVRLHVLLTGKWLATNVAEVG